MTSSTRHLGQDGICFIKKGELQGPLLQFASFGFCKAGAGEVLNPVSWWFTIWFKFLVPVKG
ncbi:MAG: hypothetical protein D6816_02760 [Bacteroidetes bacterium]|nr:MAG: hypothetical protein D6816_02760 [Bacteroidota bacterium]